MGPLQQSHAYITALDLEAVCRCRFGKLRRLPPTTGGKLRFGAKPVLFVMAYRSPLLFPELIGMLSNLRLSSDGSDRLVPQLDLILFTSSHEVHYTIRKIGR